jgi:hypothetical protein
MSDMPADFPYMGSNKNLKSILERIREAGTPPKFTHDFLKSTLGFASSNDRAVIQVLKSLGFLTADGIPTDRYNEFRDASKSGAAMTTGLREGWSEIFLADQRAHEKTTSQLTELFKTVAGKGEAVAKKMATTFKTLAEVADWKAAPVPSEVTMAEEPERRERIAPVEVPALGLHHDVHIHLPSTSDVAVYTAIFRALKAELLE